MRTLLEDHIERIIHSWMLERNVDLKLELHFARLGGFRGDQGKHTPRKESVKGTIVGKNTLLSSEL